jgi:hypothetical protein
VSNSAFEKRYEEGRAAAINEFAALEYHQAVANFKANIGLGLPKGQLPWPKAKMIVVQNPETDDWELAESLTQLVAEPFLKWEKDAGGRATGITW